MDGRKKYQRWIIGGLAVVVLAGGGYYFWQKNNNLPAAAAVNTSSIETVVRGDIASMVTGTGAVATAREQELVSPGAATVLSVHVTDGDVVKKGQVLFSLDCPEVEASQQQLSQYDYQLQELEAARAELNKTAESDSKVLSVNIKENQKVTKNSVLLTLVETQRMTFEVPQEQGKYWQDGNKIQMTLLEYGTTIKGVIEGDATLTTNNGMNYLIFNVLLEEGQRITTDTYAQVYHEGTGTQAAVLIRPQAQTEIKAAADGVITKLHVKEGQTVAAGETLFEMTSSSLESQIYEANSQRQIAMDQLKQKQTTITADFDGYFYAAANNDGPKNTFLQAGDSLSANEGLGKVVDSERVQIVFNVDELDITKIRLGQEVNITADALPDKTYKGTIARIAQEGTTSNNVAYYWVVIEVKDWQGLKIGMTTNIEIILEQSLNTLLVPINAVHVLQGQKYVLLAEEAESAAATEKDAVKKEVSEDVGPRKRQLPKNAVIVTTGISNDESVEILSGLTEGQKIIVDGVTRQVQTQQMQMMGGMPPGMGEMGGMGSSTGGPGFATSGARSGMPGGRN